MIVGLLMGAGYSKIDNGEVTIESPDDASKAAVGCYGAAGIYAGFIILCIGRIWWLRRQKQAVEVIG